MAGAGRLRRSPDATRPPGETGGRAPMSLNLARLGTPPNPNPKGSDGLRI